MSSMLSVVDDIDSAIEEEILRKIQENAFSLSQTGKAQLWNNRKNSF